MSTRPTVEQVRRDLASTITAPTRPRHHSSRAPRATACLIDGAVCGVREVRQWHPEHGCNVTRYEITGPGGKATLTLPQWHRLRCTDRVQTSLN